MMSLQSKLDKNWLEDIRAASVDELAPRFASVISALLEGGARYPYADSAFFLPSTVLTPGYREVLIRVNEILEHRTCGSFLLNFDMGTGKTHLLTLLLHLYGVCARDPEAYGVFLAQYVSEGLYDPQLAAKTVVLAVDMRAPGEVFSKQFRFFARQLERVGAHEAAQIVERAAREERSPDSKELATAIPRDVHAIVLVDELHHALIHASGLEKERVARVVDFLMTFLNYRRGISDFRYSALILIFASAKRDLEEWERVKRFEEYQALAAKVDSLMNQLERIRVLSRTEWLDIDEAKKIIATRLKLKTHFDGVFYGFDGFLKRVLKEDTDIPQAHHLRSLIKAMAIYALNALNANDPLATPAHFSEEVVGALFLGSQLETKYRSLYNEIVSEARGDRDLTYAVNAVFTASVTGDEKKQLEMVRQYMTGGERRGILDIPVLKERDLQDVLSKLGMDAGRVRRALDRLDGLHPRLCSVRTPEGYAYFVAPAVSVSALYKQLIRRLEGSYAQNKPYLTQRLSEKLQSFVVTEPNVVFQPFASLDELERLSFREDQLYLLLYADAGGALDQGRRSRLLQDAESFLASKRKLNIVIAVPIIGDGELRSATRYLAIHEATTHLIDNYLSQLYQRAPGEGGLELELLRLQESEVYSALGRYCNEAGSELTRALSKCTLLCYTQEGTVARKDVELTPPTAEARMPREIAKVLQRFNQHIGDCVQNVANELAKAAKSAAKFLDQRDRVAAAVLEEVKAMLESRGEAVIYSDVHTYSGFYVPHTVVKDVLPIVVNRLKEKYGENLAIEDRDRPVPAKIVRLKAPAPQPPGAGAVTAAETPAGRPEREGIRLPAEGTSISALTQALRQVGGGVTVTLEFEVAKDSDKLGQLCNVLHVLEQSAGVRRWRITPA